MRIAHVTATFPPYSGGTGNVCFHNARELVLRGHNVHVFTTAESGTLSYEKREGIEIHRLRPLFRFGNAPILPDLLKLNGFDIIHLHHPFIFGAEMIWAVSKLRKIPYVITHHNDLIGSGFRRYLFSSYSAISNQIVIRGANKYAVVSIDHAKGCHLANLYRERWEDVIEVPNGVDVDLFKPNIDSREIRMQHQIPDRAKVILFVGGLDRAHHFKGADILMKAFAKLHRKDTVLVFIGDGDIRQDLIFLSRELGISDQVFFPGSVPNEKLPPYYCMSNILVLPSKPPESFGMVLIEAMACAIPVIASNLPGVRTVVDEGENGFLVEPGSIENLVEKIQVVLENPQLGIEMGKKGRDKVEDRYSWSKVVTRLENLYFSVLSNSRSSSYSTHNTMA